MREQLSLDRDKVFDSSAIPTMGYELGQTESVALRLESGSEYDADGVLTETDGEQSFYKKIARLRLGGNKTHEELDVIAVAAPAGSRYEKSGIPALLRHTTEGSVVIQYGQLLSSDSEGIVGRDSDLFKDLPDTVSRKHLSIQWDKDAGNLMVHNLDPTNATILLPPEESSDDRQPIDELEVAIALDPSEAKLQLDTDGSWEELAVKRSEREAQLARARRRRRLAVQATQRAIAVR